MAKTLLPTTISFALLFAVLALLTPYSTKAEADIGDITPPEILSAVISPTVFNSEGVVSWAIELTLTARVIDDLSGIGDVGFTLRSRESPSQTAQGRFLYANEIGGCPAFVAPGRDVTCP